MEPGAERPRRTRVSAHALLVRDGAILLCRFSRTVSERGEWTLPGGGIQFGEDPAQGAVREVKEETGLDVALGEVLAIDSRVDELPAGERHAIRIIYAAEVIGGQLTPEVDGSTDACEWVRLSDANGLPLIDLAQVGVRHARRRAGS